MPDYDIRLWDETSFDIDSTKWTRTAYDAGKYAFVSDYVRLVALYECGGIYLDTDVELLKSLSPLILEYPNFMGFENGNVLTSAVICTQSKSSFINLFLNYYKDKGFTDEVVKSNEANVRMMTNRLFAYGLRIDNTEQNIEIEGTRLHIFPKTYFCPLDFYHNKDFSDNTYAIHYFDASWLDEDTMRRIRIERSRLYKLKGKIREYASLIINK